MKKYTVPLLLLATAGLLLLSGCEGMEKSMNKAADDPKYLPTAYASIAGVICFLLVVFQDWSIWQSLLNTVRYMGVLCVVGGPLYWTGSGNMEAAAALTISGLASSILVTAIFWQDFKRWSSED